jgi:hypothetical protein
MPSFVLNIPGPSAYDPIPMQREHRATQYLPWPAERRTDPRVTATIERMAAETQLRVDAENKRRAASMVIPQVVRALTADTSHLRRPPHAGGPLGHAPPGLPRRSLVLRPMTSDARAGLHSARALPSGAPTRPRYVAPEPVVRPSSTPPLTLFKYPAAASTVSYTAEARTSRLLNRLFAVARRGGELANLPVLPHPLRRRSAERGLSLPALRALRNFYAAQGALDLPIDAVCGGDGGGGLCSLTRHTGLSLVETLVLAAEEGEGSLQPLGRTRRSTMSMSASSGITVASGAVIGIAGVVGAATTVVRCAAGGLGATRLFELFDAIDEAVGEDAAATRHAGSEPRARYVWIDFLATSQNLLSGRYGAERFETGTAARAAREEDAAGAAAEALASAREVFEFEPAVDASVGPGGTSGMRASIRLRTTV